MTVASGQVVDAYWAADQAVLSPWEVDPLPTPALRATRVALLQQGGFDALSHADRYVLYRSVTRALLGL